MQITIGILHASGELDRLRKVTFVRYLHHVSPDTLVILGKDRSRVFDFGWTWRRRTRILRFLLRWYAFSSSIIGRRRFIPALDGRCRRRDRFTLDRFIQHAYSALGIKKNMKLLYYLSVKENTILDSLCNLKMTVSTLQSFVLKETSSQVP